MSDVVKQDGTMSNCVAMEVNSEKILTGNCHNGDGNKTENNLIKATGVAKTASSLNDNTLDLDEGELGRLFLFEGLLSHLKNIYI